MKNALTARTNMKFGIAAVLCSVTTICHAQLHDIPDLYDGPQAVFPGGDPPASSTENAFKAWYNYWKQEFDLAFQTRQVRLDEVEILIREQAQTGQLQGEAAAELLEEYDDLKDGLRVIGQRKRAFHAIAEVGCQLRFTKPLAQLGLFPGPLDFGIALLFYDSTAKTDGYLAANASLATSNFPIFLSIATSSATMPTAVAMTALLDIDHQLQKTAELEDRFREVLRGVDAGSQTVAVIGGVGSDKAELDAWIGLMKTRPQIDQMDGIATRIHTAEYIRSQLNRWDERHVADIHPPNGGDEKVDEQDYAQFRYGEDTSGLSDEEKRRKGDFDLDGTVEFDDYLHMANGWTSPNPPPPPQ